MRVNRLSFLMIFMVATLISCGFVQSLRDGGSIPARNGQDLYWAEDDFPLWLLIDDQLPSQYAEATVEAALLWNSEIGEQVFEPQLYDFSRPAPRGNGLVVVSTRDLGLTDRNTRRLGAARAVPVEGTHHMSASQVWLDTDLDESVLFIVALHELGHALTLDHDKDCGSIMHPTVVTCEGVAQIRPEDAMRVHNMVAGAYTTDLHARIDFLLEAWRDSCIH